MLTPERLKAIKERCELATPGPWQWDDTPWGEGATLLAFGRTDGLGRPVPLLDDGSAAGEYAPQLATEADREFIAHAREDVPALVAEVERLHTLVRNLHDQVRRWREEAEQYDRWSWEGKDGKQKWIDAGIAEGLDRAAHRLEAVLHKLEAKRDDQ